MEALKDELRRQPSDEPKQPQSLTKGNTAERGKTNIMIDEEEIDPVMSPRVGEVHIFLNALGYKQKAVVREKNGENLTVEWIANDRRYSHGGISTRSTDIDPVYLHEEIMRESSSSLLLEDADERAQKTGCNA